MDAIRQTLPLSPSRSPQRASAPPAPVVPDHYTPSQPDPGYYASPKLGLDLRRLVGEGSATAQRRPPGVVPETGGDWEVGTDPGNPYRMRRPEGLIEESRAQGRTTVRINGVDIQIFGNASPEELAFLRGSLGRLPPTSCRTPAKSIWPNRSGVSATDARSRASPDCPSTRAR